MGSPVMGLVGGTGFPPRMVSPTLMMEVASAGEDHRALRLLHGGDHLVVALRAAGLDDRPHPGLERQPGPVGEREEGVRREYRSLEIVTELAGLREGVADSVYATRLTAPDPDRWQALRDDDRVRRDVLAQAPGEEQAAPHGFTGISAGDPHAVAILRLEIRVLDEQPPENALEVALPRRFPPAL